MFTGLIETVGTVTSVQRSGLSVTLALKPDMCPFDVPIGGSVAIDGVCLTVEKNDNGLLRFTAVLETLRRTTLDSVTIGRRVNLERALLAGGRLDGHMVLGHVDAIGVILSDSQAGVSLLRTISIPSTLLPFVAEKGSVALDGISLTVASVNGDTMTISLIPHTMGQTTMVHKRPGNQVNIECDVVARYLYRFVNCRADDGVKQSGDSLISRMERLGF